MIINVHVITCSLEQTYQKNKKSNKYYTENAPLYFSWFWCFDDLPNVLLVFTHLLQPHTTTTTKV